MYEIFAFDVSSYERRLITDESEARRQVRSLFLVFFHLSGAVRDDADGGAVQPHEVSHLFGSILVKMNGPVNPLVGKESGTG
jgi:hypothetical protein